ncbi:25.3 kDa vesicle transport protein isoform X2 [Macadamia integrifolia]|uniref:25.3 kDa vesicle transport protein isoform X2 n=1 Tax=Macadamia integrifolia TaxID=60698 RepID=UPI001C4EEB8D|nr:25.3 kDa vesicle transport protein isoform X2 [Macadamia integrifolia]
MFLPKKKQRNRVPLVVLCGEMVKLTIVGRVSDGLPIAQGPRYVNEENDNMLFYKQQGEFILKEISRGVLSPSKMSIRIDHYCFYFLVDNGFCYSTLCESSYPRKLAFHYLQDLQRELGKVEPRIVETISRPYSFIRFGNIRKQYLDARTQANLSKLNANRRQELDIMTEDISKIIENKRNSEILQKVLLSSGTVSSIWCSPCLEVIALKWTPITIILLVSIVLLWSYIILSEYNVF